MTYWRVGIDIASRHPDVAGDSRDAADIVSMLMVTGMTTI